MPAEVAGQRPLLERAAAGDREAFARLYDDQVEGVYRYLLAWTGDRSEAAELTGQVFHGALGWLPATTAGDWEVGAWLIALARDAVAQRRGSEGAAGPSGPGPPAPDPLAAVARLGDTKREVVVLRLLLGHSLSHTAHLCGYSQRAVLELQLAACLTVWDLTSGPGISSEARDPESAEEFERRLANWEIDLTGTHPPLADALGAATSIRQSIPGHVVAPAPDLVTHLRQELTHPEAVESQPGSLGAQPGAVGTHPGAVRNHPGAVGTHSGAVGTHPGADGTHPGASGTHPKANGTYPGPAGIHLGPGGTPRAPSVAPLGANGTHPEAPLTHPEAPLTHPEASGTHPVPGRVPRWGSVADGRSRWVRLSTGWLVALFRRPWLATGVATAGIVLVLTLQAFGEPGAPPRPAPATVAAAAPTLGGTSLGTPLTTVVEPSTTTSTQPALTSAPAAPRATAPSAPPTTRPATTAPQTTRPRPTTTRAPTTTAPTTTTAPVTTTTAAPAPT